MHSAVYIHAGDCDRSLSGCRYDVALAGAFRAAPVVFASMASFNGGDPSSMRISGRPSATSVSLFVEEETCTDAEQAHAAEVVGVLAIEASVQVDSQLQATLSAGLGDLTYPMIAENDFVHIPNGAPGAGSGEAQYKFRCTAAVDTLTLAFEVRAPNGNDDSFYIGMDHSDHITWCDFLSILAVFRLIFGCFATDLGVCCSTRRHIPHANTDGGVSATGATGTTGGASGCVRGHCDDNGGFHWATYQDTFDIRRGKHTLHVYGREDGTQLRKVRFVNAPGCNWSPTLPTVAPMIAATFGALTAPMTRKDDFIWVPETFVAGATGQVGEGGCIDGRENRYELTAAAYGASDHCSAAAEYTFSCRNDATVAFDYEVMSPNGNDDSFYIQVHFCIQMMNFVSKNEKFCVKKTRNCVKTRKFCFENDEFCIQIDDGEVFLWSTGNHQVSRPFIIAGNRG